jgi:hypothetical protein
MNRMAKETDWPCWQKIMDDTYTIYTNRLAEMTATAAYTCQVDHLQKSSKFRRSDNHGWEAVAFPGYTVITSPWEEASENEGFYAGLWELQKVLAEELFAGMMVSLPPASFHLTLADLICDDGYRQAVASYPNFEERLQESIRDSFQEYKSLGDSYPNYWRFGGIIVMPSAVGVALLPQDGVSYQRVVALRRCIYGNAGVMGLGIAQQFHFTAHITLGYWGEVFLNSDRDWLGWRLSRLNEWWLDNYPSSFWIKQAELRKFDDMTCFYRDSHFPIVAL